MNRTKAKSCENISSNAVIGAERSQALQSRLLQGIGSETAAEAKEREIKRLLALTPSQCYNTLANQLESANQYGSTANILQGPLAAQSNPSAAPQPAATPKPTLRQRTLPNDEASQEAEQAEKAECVSNKFHPVTMQQQASPLRVLSLSAHGLASNQAIQSQERSAAGLSHRSRNHIMNTGNSLPGFKNIPTENSFISITKLPVEFPANGCTPEEKSQTQAVAEILPFPHLKELRVKSLAASRTCKLKHTSKFTDAQSEKSKHS